MLDNNKPAVIPGGYRTRETEGRGIGDLAPKITPRGMPEAISTGQWERQ